ncbi:MAG: 1-deoxy-D-xylulose-5-phosphate synthase [Deltaproteobacteria bacterium HGW-Deltaproteobacteria-19]|jgi:1-deoxy-D-xylulose-5-phosphate synthase|nr:MAG: 1-deoxy-D-xylulose-5-phosphate synthase [Deltaproteobacteria bacterium HGW-Deltaproteobacteria-19]
MAAKEEKPTPRAVSLTEIQSPADIRGLEISQLSLLAEEIRTLIIQTVSVNGGHLASSLGAVELTLAIHKVFDTPRDKLVWDVGHQAYAHKIITERRERFSTLRRRGGISGFPKREESPYDVFNVGHSGTSISAATGIAEARCLQGNAFKVIVVIGDGSMTSGMAYEGLNWAGDRKKDLIIILNDNEMSISPNVGALSSYMNRMMTGQRAMKIRSEVKSFFRTLPGIGEQMVKFSRQAEEALKGFIVPGALFEDLGFTYVGPLEGHRLDHLVKNLENVREMPGPVLVHVVTRKGKGYAPAESRPLQFHGIGPFRIETGEPLAAAGGRISYSRMFGNTLVRLAEKDSRIVAITAAMCEGTGLDAFARQYPTRFFDVGIAEQHAVTFAAGLATEGIIPVVAIYSTFLQRSYDQILHDVCLQKLPVVLALDRGGFVGDDGPTHHGLFDLSFLRSIPNMTVLAPKDENEFQHMLKTAVEWGAPIAIRYPRGAVSGVQLDDDLYTLPVGRGEVLCEGTDLAIMAIGATVLPALAAAERLREEGIGARVVNARSVKPLDAGLLCASAARTRKVLTVEENVLMGGFGSAVLELFQEKGLRDVAVVRLGVPDTFVEQATMAELRSLYGIDEEGILRAARSLARSGD